LGKKAKLRRYREEIEANISDLGLLAAKLQFTKEATAEAERRIVATLPSASDYREFMALHDGLHRLFLRFGAQARA
jgi:hypothetical protein